MACYGPAELAEELACPVCFEDYDFQVSARIPKLLDCRHTFCGPCITRSLEEDGSLECCICRLVHKNVNPEELIANYVITNHLRELQEQKDHEIALNLQKEIDQIEEEFRKKEQDEKRAQEEHDAAVARKKEEEQKQRALASASSSSQTPADVAVQQHLGQVLSEMYSVSGYNSSSDVKDKESDESFDSVVAFIEQITELRLDKNLGKMRLEEIITQQQKQLLEDAESQQGNSRNNQEVLDANDLVDGIDDVKDKIVPYSDDDEENNPNEKADEEDAEGNESDLDSNESFHTVEEDYPNESVLIIENESNEISKNTIVISDSDSSESENDNENNNRDSGNIGSENEGNLCGIVYENISPQINANHPSIICEVAPRPPLRRSKRRLTQNQ